MRSLARLLLVLAVVVAAPSHAQTKKPVVPNDVAVIDSDAGFDRMARVTREGRFLELPQVKFVIDRSRTPAQVRWINTRKFGLHYYFLKAKYLTLADADAFNEANYSKPDRQFILGSLVRYPRLGKYGVELWEGDIVEPSLLTAMMERLQASFHAPLTFKPNSGQQEEAARASGLATISAGEAYGSRDQLILNRGRAVGRLVIVAEGQEDDLLPGDIALMDSAPIRIPPVAGIISSRFSTPINHVNLLAKSWKIPNAYKAEAGSLWAALAGKQVLLDTRGAQVVVRAASAAEVRAAQKARWALAVRVPAADITFLGLPSLAEQDASWSKRTGAKAANLAEVAALAREDAKAGFAVPPGLSIPFAYYERFVAGSGLKARIDALLAGPGRGDPKARAAELAAIREGFAVARIDSADMGQIKERVRAVLGDAGLFVRSSTNAEDLAGFNGAGLYDTVPNVKGNAALEAAILKVWGSLWNDRAFAAREAAGIDHRAVRAACLVQLGVNADAAGVMTTIDPFDESNRTKRYFIAAKRGLGIRVVEGKRIAEQLIYREALDSIQVLTRSDDDTMLRFGPDGGVIEVAIDPKRAVLSDDLVRRLAKIGRAIELRFDGRPQDIEWLLIGDTINIVQSRDYVRGNWITSAATSRQVKRMRSSGGTAANCAPRRAMKLWRTISACCSRP